MSKIYTIAFKMGVLFNVLLFTAANLVSYQIALSEYENQEIRFSPCCRLIWGFPLSWGETYYVIVEGGTILNIFFWIVCGFAFGFLFKFVWSQISRRQAELK